MAKNNRKTTPIKSVKTKKQLKEKALSLFETVLDNKLGLIKGGQGIEIKFNINTFDEKSKIYKVWLRNSNEYKQWRRAVFERDSYKCRICSKGGKLQAHHVKPFSKCVKEEVLDIGNGLTVCLNCHAKIHPHLRIVKLSKFKTNGHYGQTSKPKK